MRPGVLRLACCAVLAAAAQAFVLVPAPPSERAARGWAARQRAQCGEGHVSGPGAQNQRRQRSEARHNKLSDILREAAGGGADAADLAALRGLMSRGDTYDSAMFTPPHLEFKAAHNAICIALAEWVAAGGDGRKPNVFYLDGSDGGTTVALRCAGFHTSQLHVANMFEETVEALLLPPHSLDRDRIVHGRAEDALSGHFRTADIGVYYLDGCSGMTAPLIEMLQALFANQALADRRVGGGGGVHGKWRRRLAIGFTLTEAEPTGRSLADREQDVVRALVSAGGALGFTSARAQDQPQEYGIDAATLKKQGGTMTTWLVCERPAA